MMGDLFYSVIQLKAGASLNFDREDEGDTHLTCTVPAVLRLHPQLLVPVDQAVGAAGPLAVTALQLGQPGLCVVQLRTNTETRRVTKPNQKSTCARRLTRPQRAPGPFCTERCSAGSHSLEGH